MKYQQLFLMALAATLVSTVAQDAPINTNSILKELDQVDANAKNQVSSRRSASLSKIQSASSSTSSAVELYLQALDATKYGDKHSDFVEWRQKNAEFLRSNQFQTAAQLQLRYLLLALQRSEQNDAFAQIPLCMAYLNDLSVATTGQFSQNQKAPKTTSSASIDKAVQEANSLIKQSLNDTAVVKWLEIDDLLPDGKDFASSPGNYETIIEKNIRVPMRTKNDPRLPGTWDLQMKFIADVATSTGSQQQADDFNKNRLPDFLFKKAQDTALIGHPNRAIGDIMALIHRYPSNPDVRDWVKAARDLLPKVTPPPTAPTPAPAATNSPMTSVQPTNAPSTPTSTAPNQPVPTNP
ncbi:MAG: hypothetical protein WCP60_11580 [bacterium]